MAFDNDLHDNDEERGLVRLAFASGAAGSANLADVVPWKPTAALPSRPNQQGEEQ